MLRNCQQTWSPSLTGPPPPSCGQNSLEVLGLLWNQCSAFGLNVILHFSYWRSAVTLSDFPCINNHCLNNSRLWGYVMSLEKWKNKKTMLSVVIFNFVYCLFFLFFGKLNTLKIEKWRESLVYLHNIIIGVVLTWLIYKYSNHQYWYMAPPLVSTNHYLIQFIVLKKCIKIHKWVQQLDYLLHSTV